MNQQSPIPKQDLSYFTCVQAEQYSFFKYPHLLNRHPVYNKYLRDGSKIIYGMLLERMELSRRNGWIDENGHVYIIYTNKELCEDLNYGHGKVTECLKELKDIGLIVIKRRPNAAQLIYVMDFMSITNARIKNAEKQTFDDHPKDINDDSSSDDNNINTPETAKQTEVRKSDFRKSENRHSGDPKTGIPEIRKSAPNKTNIDTDIHNKTDNNKTDIDLSIYQSDTDTSVHNKAASQPIDRMDGKDTDQKQVRQQKNHAIYKSLILSNIDYEKSFASDPHDKDLVDEIVELMTDTVCGNSDTVRVNGQDMDGDTVRSRLLKLNQEHIQYVLDALSKTSTDVKNIRAYLLTTLYNSYTTITTYWDARVRHDMASG